MNGTAEEQLAILQNAEVHGKFLVFLSPTTFVLVLFTLYLMNLSFSVTLGVSKNQKNPNDWEGHLANIDLLAFFNSKYLFERSIPLVIY